MTEAVLRETHDSRTTSARALLTLDELTDRVGMSVRNIRFYTTKGLVPPPLRRGRSGYYSADHVARLELVRELQDHGFTLSAIKGYVDRIPEDATPSDIALHLSLLAPMTGEQRGRRRRRAGRRRRARPAAEAVAEVYAGTASRSPTSCPRSSAPTCGRRCATPAGSVENLRELVHRLKPLTIAGLVSAYELAMDAPRRRTTASARTDPLAPPPDGVTTKRQGEGSAERLGPCYNHLTNPGPRPDDRGRGLPHPRPRAAARDRPAAGDPAHRPVAPDGARRRRHADRAAAAAGRREPRPEANRKLVIARDRVLRPGVADGRRPGHRAHPRPAVVEVVAHLVPGLAAARA